MDEKLIAGFRKRLIEDASFRKEFAADPDGALRTVGINVPSGATIAPIDASELEGRVTRLKQALGTSVSDLYTVEDFSKVAKDPARVQRIEEIMNIARKSRTPVDEASLTAVAGGVSAEKSPVYTISAFGTLDW